jgi:hypothetical protein
MPSPSMSLLGRDSKSIKKPPETDALKPCAGSGAVPVLHSKARRGGLQCQQGARRPFSSNSARAYRKERRLVRRSSLR